MESEARLVQVEERLTNVSTNLGGRIGTLEQAVASGFAKFDQGFQSLSAEFRSGTKTPWATIIGFGGIGLTAFSVIGWLAYAPIASRQGDLGNVLSKLSDKMDAGFADRMTRDELNYRTSRAQEDRERAEFRLRRIEGKVFP